MNKRCDDVGQGVKLEILTLAWMLVEASVSIGAGVVAHSLLLLAFGVDSVIELLSAGLLLYRLGVEARGKPAALETLERRTSRLAGGLLYLLSLYVVVQAVLGLLYRHRAETSWWGIGIAAGAALGMPLLAKAKIRVADSIGSAALRADAMETLTCGFLARVLLAGLLVNWLFHWWWLDSAVALAIVPLLLREAKEAVTGECCSHCHDCAGPPGQEA